MPHIFTSFYPLVNKRKVNNKLVPELIFEFKCELTFKLVCAFIFELIFELTSWIDIRVDIQIDNGAQIDIWNDLERAKNNTKKL